jgi:arabinogalactan endo-1,4-beta-galactosidase
MSKIRLSLLAALSLGLVLGSLETYGQSFYFGADLSYVNEMEDCGVSYKEDGKPKDVHEMFADHGCNLVRLRLWHTPSWYDGLNNGNRYSDLADVKIAIGRAHAAGMEVLLDFHLSDNWADPGKQEAEKGIGSSLFLFWMTVAIGALVMATHLWRSL